MKKTLKKTSCILSAFLLLNCGKHVFADKAIGNYKYENFTYNINSDQSVTLISCDSSVTSVHIPNEIDGMTVSEINGATFENCNSLEEITVSEDNPYFSVSIEGILMNKAKTKLIRCPAAAEIFSYAVPSDVTSISPYCFENVYSLEYITISESVKTIGKSAFKGTSFNNVTLPNPDIKIGTQAFGYNMESDKNEEFNLYAESGSAANTYAAENEINFIANDHNTFNISVNGNLYFYNDDKSFSGEEIIITNKKGEKVGYSFSSTPEKIFSENITNTTKVDIVSILGNKITTINVRVAMPGDANQDGKLNVRDAAFTASALANGKSFTGFDKMCADKNKDDTANIRDAAEIARTLAEIR